jgi:photosystem II stability/assembly factor-like uncharacterized protein
MNKLLGFLLLTMSAIVMSSCVNRPQKVNDLPPDNDIRQDYFLMRSGEITKNSVDKFKTAVNRIFNQSKNIDFQKSWRFEGPQNVNGRVNVVALHPSDSKTWLVGESTGGIFKTTDGGQSYSSVFDKFNYLSISEIVYHPVNHNIVFAGTGDENISGYPFSGDGIYRSTDGGNTWQPFALQNVGIISKICIHPQHPDTIFAASMGVPFYADSLRGVFRTYDGGNTWQNVLLPDTTAGVIDMMIDYNDPNTIYAVGWNRVRNNHLSLAKGMQSQLYVSRDGGNTWQISNLTGSLSVHSRIGIDQSRTSSNRLVAVVTNSYYDLEGIYYSDDTAHSWQGINVQGVAGTVYGSFGWYFGQIRFNPYNANKIYLPGVSLHQYDFQTGVWSSITALHVDNHDIDFLSEDSLIASTDGGLFLSADGGHNWSDIDNIPSTQFYRIAFNPAVSGDYWGGLQDNGTVKGNANVVNGWNTVFWGDGFQVVFDRKDTSVVYVESQNGGLAFLVSGFYSGDFVTGIQKNDRRSWDMPYINDKNNVFYTGTFRVYKNQNAPWGVWNVSSPCLTDTVNSRYHVITALGVSELNPDFVYAGTSDGHVWRSVNAGNNWTEISNGLPGLYVTSVEASPDFANTVYVAHSGYRDNNNQPHIHKSTDKGNSWTGIDGDLPDLAINAIVIMPHQNDSILFVATDGGVFGTVNGGINWNRVGDNMPVFPVFDLVYDSVGRKLVAGTYARGMYSIPVDSIVPGLYNGINTSIVDNHLKVFPNPAVDFINIKIPECYACKNATIVIYNSSGKAVLTEKITAFDNVIRLSTGGLSSGIYYLTMSQDNNLKLTGRFIINRI